MFSFTGKQFHWINFLCFQLVWFAAVYFTNDALAILILLLIVHFYLSPSRYADLKVIFTVMPIGCLSDSLLSQSGVFIFANGSLLPLWLVCLWAYFTLTLNHSLAWLKRLPLYAQALSGAIFGPLSYYGGYKMGAVNFSESLFSSLFILMVIWATLLPVYIVLSHLSRSAYVLPQKKRK